jgi:hypothetical protein
VQQTNIFLFLGQVFFDCGFAALLAERLCLSGRAFKESAAPPPRQSLKQLKLNGKPEAFRKESGKAVNPHSLFLCGCAALCPCVENRTLGSATLVQT